MAADITLLQSFVDGQGAGAATYVGYAADFDSNFAIIEAGFNALNAEFKASGGQNALIALDLALSSSPALTEGFVGTDSFAPVAFLTADTQIQIPPGVAHTAAAGRVETTQTFTFTGSGASGTRWIALQENGTLTQETSAGGGILDLFSVTWNGAAFTTSTLTRLPTSGGVIVDGDDFQNSKVQEDISQGSSAIIPPFTYDRIDYRVSDLLRILAGIPSGGSATSSQVAGSGAPVGPTLKPIAIGGSATTPGVIVGNPAGGYAATTGLFGTPASASLGIAIEAVQLVLCDASTASEPQMRFRNGTSLTNPPLSFVDADNGLGYVTADEWRAISGGLEVARFIESASNPILGIQDGAEATPSFAFEADRDTGLYRPGADQAALSVGGNQAILVDGTGSLGVVDLPLNSRVRTFQDAQTVTQSALTNLNHDNEDFDIGAWHDTVTNNDRHTVPTGHDGVYTITGHVAVLESTASAGGTANAGNFRHAQIELNGSAVNRGGNRVLPAASGDTQLPVCETLTLAAGDIIRLQVAHDNGGDVDVDSELTIVKVA